MCILYFSLLYCCMTSNRALFVGSKLKTEIIKNCMKSTLCLSLVDRHSLFKSTVHFLAIPRWLFVFDISSTCSILLHVPLRWFFWLHLISLYCNLNTSVFLFLCLPILNPRLTNGGLGVSLSIRLTRYSDNFFVAFPIIATLARYIVKPQSK